LGAVNGIRSQVMPVCRLPLIWLVGSEHSPSSELTGFEGPILADPGRDLYQTLGLIENLARTPAHAQKKSYLSKGIFSNILSSIWVGKNSDQLILRDSIITPYQQGPLKHPEHIGKQGNIHQLGGDFIFGPGACCLFGQKNAVALKAQIYINR
jgi:hypothetical protein